MRVVVTGGRGNLGREVMRALTERGHQPVNASRRSGVDVRSGAGLDAVLKRADAVVHTADTLRPWEFRAVTLGGTQRLADTLAALDRRGPLVYISLVGVDRSPYAYYRMKHAAELAISERPIAATVVRATQFHSLAAAMVGMRPGPFIPAVRGMRLQPVDIRWIGERLAQIATDAPPQGFTRHRDLSGPDRFATQELALRVARHAARRHPRVVSIPPVGGTLRAFADGIALPAPDAEIGGESFAAWLERQPPRLPRR